MKSEFGSMSEFAEAEFCRNLPCGGRTYQNRIGPGPDEFASTNGKSGIVGKPPEQGMSVQQEAQSSLPSGNFGFWHWFKEIRTDD